VGTGGAFTHECLSALLRSIDAFEGEAEAVLVFNGLSTDQRRGLDAVVAHPAVRLLEHPERLGSAPARCLGIRTARADLILLTDADCRVPVDWVATMAAAAAGHRVVSGHVESDDGPRNAYVRVQQEIDRLRNSAALPGGSRRYPTVSNMAAPSELLRLVDDDPLNTTEDFQLSTELIAREIPVVNLEHVVVTTQYPATFLRSVRRQERHAIGTAYAQRQWSRSEWRRMGMAGPLALAATSPFRAWRMRLRVHERAIAWALRLCFAVQWARHLIRLRGRPARQTGGRASR